MSSAIAVLTAMITPAVLISACGSMILSTSGRLGRVVDRVRALSDRLEEMAEKPGDTQVARERQAVIFSQLDKLTSRARILQRSMVTFYVALGMFVATSVAIGVVGIAGNQRYKLVPVIVGMLGACFLFYGSMSLIFKARAWRSVRSMLRWISSGGKLLGSRPLIWSSITSRTSFTSEDINETRCSCLRRWAE